MRVGDVYALEGMVKAGKTEKEVLAASRFRQYNSGEIKKFFAHFSNTTPPASVPEPAPEATSEEVSEERPKRTRRKVVGDD